MERENFMPNMVKDISEVLNKYGHFKLTTEVKFGKVCEIDDGIPAIEIIIGDLEKNKLYESRFIHEHGDILYLSLEWIKAFDILSRNCATSITAGYLINLKNCIVDRR